MDAIKADFKTSVFFALAMLIGANAFARPYNYPAVRYQNAESQALGGVTLPLVNELGNDLFNNPAALSKNTKFRAEYLNLNLEANNNVLGSLGLSTPKMLGLGGMTETLNANTGKVFGAGFGNLTAFSWGGLGVGLLFQERVRAVTTDGVTVNYETMSQFVPSAGYAVALARGVVRLGYSLQYVNQASGIASAPSNSGASFLSGINQGWGLSHNASVNFIFPFTYLPTFSLMGRNIGGMHFNSGSIFSRAKSPVGTPNDEPMTVDGAMNFTVRVSGTFKTLWYVQLKDMTSSTSLTMMERLGLGVDLGFTPQFGVRAGFTGTMPSLGIGYRSDASEINLAWYTERNPFAGVDDNDTRYTLQYKIFFQDKNVREKDSDKKKNEN